MKIFRTKQRRELKRWQLILVLGMVAIGLIIKIYDKFHVPTATLNVGGAELVVRVANTPALRYRGWSGYKNMGKFQGMLFLFPERGPHTMVMRDMNFAIDIVWVDGDRIVDMAPNVQPEPGKSEAELTRYFARDYATMVLELPPGFAVQNQLKVGGKVQILKQNQ